MLEFLKHDPDIAETVLEKFKRHTWYLNQEYAPLSLFSPNVDAQEKSAIAKKIYSFKPPSGKPKIGIPNVVEVNSEARVTYRLSDFVQNGSHYMFQQMKFGSKWLRKPVGEWSKDESFLEMERFVKTLLVTNDAAERGVKLLSDYAKSLTKNSKERDALLQVVEQNRRELPTCSKKAMSKYFGQ